MHRISFAFITWLWWRNSYHGNVIMKVAGTWKFKLCELHFLFENLHQGKSSKQQLKFRSTSIHMT